MAPAPPSLPAQVHLPRDLADRVRRLPPLVFDAATAGCAAAILRSSLPLVERAIQNPPPGFDDLTVHDQIEYVQTLWERIVAREDEVSVPEWHKAEIDLRLVEYEAAPEAGRSWEEVEADLWARLATR